MKLDQNKLVNACERMTKLMADPHPGLATWNIIAQRTAEEIGALFVSKDDARALWAVRVLDAWQKAHVMRAEPFRCYAPFDLEVDAPLNWLCTANADDGVSRRFLALTPDAARFAAAEAVFPTLPADVREELGEKP